MSSYSPLSARLQIVPRAGAREERLAHVEAEAVVVGVEEPRRHVVRRPVVRLHRRRIEDVEAEQLDLVRGVVVRLSSPDSSTSGRPHTLKIWLERMFLSRSPIMRSGVACT